MPSKCICPVCGGSGVVTDPKALSALALPHHVRQTLSAFIRAYPRPVTAEVLISLLWADDPNGGPADAEGQVRVYVYRVNKVIRPLGWEISAATSSERRLTYIGD